MNFREYILVGAFLIIANYSYSQFNNSTFHIGQRVDRIDSNKFSLSVRNADFLKNNEYFNKIVQGYTLIGFYLQPRLVYQATPNLKLEGGVHLQKYSGLNKFTQVLPVFTVNYQAFNWLNIIIGTLYGSINHCMIDPVFDFERVYKNNVENGVQIIVDHKRIRSDLWLNWEKFIFEHSTFQEELVFGNSTELNITAPGKRVILAVPLQFLFAHKGGQDLNIPGHHVETLMNLAYGMHLGLNLNDKIVQRLVFRGYVTHYKDLSALKVLQYKNGLAFYPSLALEGKFFDLMVAYWDGKQFIAPRGEAYYQSISHNDSVYTESNRRLITLKLGFHHTISKGIEAGVRFEGYYDIQHKIFEYSYGLYLIFMRDFLLKKIKG